MSQPLFILTTMRSYSSLVSTMLGQHPQMYGLPELNLFVVDQLRAMFAFSAIVRPNTVHGLLRTVAELEFGDQSKEAIEQARAWLKQRDAWSCRRVFRHIAERVAPRICIEKSPSTTFKPEFIENARRAYPDAFFLHLVRHPRRACRSLHRLVTETDRKVGREARDQDPEQSWVNANRNIVEFMETLPPGQGMRIRGEDLLSDPGRYLPQICQWLGIRDDQEALAEMLHPENSPFARLGPEGATFGNDPNFLQDPRFIPRDIPEETLEGPLEWVEDREAYFDDQTMTIARELGYR